MKRNIKLFLSDIVESIENIESFSKGITKDKFEKNKLRQSAVIRQLEIIGEAASNIESDYRANNAEIPWRTIIGLRNVLIHDYMDVDLDVVWQIITQDLPVLAMQVDKILGQPGT